MFPDFLCIGAQKAGTTWLHANLSQHPEVWMPPVKELHYFNKALGVPAPLSPRYLGRTWRRQLRQRASDRWKGRDLKALGWDLNFFFRWRDEDWYARLFEPGRGLRTGEVTPGYSKLDQDQVAHVAGLMPDARILFLMRDPVERAWSSARMAADRRGLDLGDVRSWKKHFDRQKLHRGDYLRTLRNWRAHYPEERIFIGFFDEIQSAPEEILMRVYAFLDVSAERRMVPESATRRFNVSSGVGMPEEVEQYLAEMYLDDLRELHGMFGEPVAPWLERAQRCVAGTG